MLKIIRKIIEWLLEVMESDTGTDKPDHFVCN